MRQSLDNVAEMCCLRDWQTFDLLKVFLKSAATSQSDSALFQAVALTISSKDEVIGRLFIFKYTCTMIVIRK